MIENNKKQWIYAFQRALLFNITYNTKLIWADIIDDKLIIWVYLDREPTEDEKDVYYSVSAELAGNFMELDGSISEVHFSTENYIEEDFRDKLLLFARCDYLDSKGNMKVL